MCVIALYCIVLYCIVLSCLALPPGIHPFADDDDDDDDDDNDDNNNNNNVQQKPLMWHLIWPELLLFTKKEKLHQWNRQISGSSSQTSKSVNTITILLSPDSLSPTLSTPAMKTPENTEDEPDGTRRYPNGILPISCTIQAYEQLQKVTCKSLGQYRYCLIIQNIR